MFRRCRSIRADRRPRVEIDIGVDARASNEWRRGRGPDIVRTCSRCPAPYTGCASAGKVGVIGVSTFGPKTF